MTFYEIFIPLLVGFGLAMFYLNIKNILKYTTNLGKSRQVKLPIIYSRQSQRKNTSKRKRRRKIFK